MIWIPILYVCLSNIGCAFLQGKPTYTEAGCEEQLAQASFHLQQDPRVSAFDLTCVLVAHT